MTPQRANEINAALVAHSMYAMDLRDDPPPSLAGYALRELLDATDQVHAEDNAKPCPKSTRCVCAERLIAALYVLTHYPAQESGEVESIANNERAGLFVIRAAAQGREDGE